ncbi:MAG: hypothetical protein RJQ14_03055 [Marinoscillum sp.]
MEHTFILGTYGHTKGRADQAAHLVLGCLGLLLGFLTLISPTLTILKLTFAGIMILGGFFNLVLSLQYITNNSRFAPKVIVRPEEIRIKSTIFSNTSIIKFSNLESISIKKRVLSVRIKDSKKIIKYRTFGIYPFEIREAVAHVADKHQVTLS